MTPRAQNALVSWIILVAIACVAGAVIVHRTVTHTVTHTVTAPAPTYQLPESARAPEGATPARPPRGAERTVKRAEHIDEPGLQLLELFEGYSRCAYYDPYGRVYTAGFGQTRGITAGFCFASRAAAEANLRASVEDEYEWAIRDLGVPLNQHEWDALCSFVYNLGAGIFYGSAIGAELRAGDLLTAANALLGYDRAGGVVLPGLRARREAERRLFLTPVIEPRPPTRAQLHAQLVHDYRYRRALRGVLKAEGCRRAHPNTPRCRVWRRHGNEVNAKIRALHALHVY